MSTKIEWTDRTWNPLAGCTMVSRACENCYAMRMAFRLEHMGQDKYKGTTRKTEGGKIIWTGKINIDEKALLQPLKWKKPQRVFVNSMSDLFHENIGFSIIDSVIAMMAITPHITYQILTKRADRMEWYMNRFKSLPTVHMAVAANYLGLSEEQIQKIRTVNWPLPNVWLGTTIENQKEADKRIPHLLNCPAAVRFVSCEPLVGPINLNGDKWGKIIDTPEGKYQDYLMGRELVPMSDGSYSAQWKGRIDWVITGGESGPNAEPSHPDWFRSLRNQCEAAGVPFFFKQWGEWMPYSGTLKDLTFQKGFFISKLNGRPVHLEEGMAFMQKLGKNVSGNQLDGKVYNEFPEAGRNEGDK